MEKKAQASEILIVGAGPAGLCLALAVARLGLRCTVLEKQPLLSIADPQDDGREIALTHRSVRLLEQLGVWAHVPQKLLGRIDKASVLNQHQRARLMFSSARTGQDRLAYMVPNHLIRAAAYAALTDHRNIKLQCGAEVAEASSSDHGAVVKLKSGKTFRARLLIAADSRFSAVRKMIGITAALHPFGRSMIVTRLAHDAPHDHQAVEWFQRDRTLAMLPLAGNCSSAVLTVDSAVADELMGLGEADYAACIAEWFGHRYGAMQPAGPRHVYPLVAAYAERFYAPSFAVVGDAAVGMHPVTAHGFNFGLRGIEILANLIEQAKTAGEDWGAEPVLAAYERQHRLATKPLYLLTNFIATLYARTDPLASVARKALLFFGQRMAFAQHLIARQLTDHAA